MIDVYSWGTAVPEVCQGCKGVQRGYSGDRVVRRDTMMTEVCGSVDVAEVCSRGTEMCEMATVMAEVCRGRTVVGEEYWGGAEVFPRA